MSDLPTSSPPPPPTEPTEPPASQPISKRQRIKSLQKSTLNLWQQHPNIKSPATRAKAYLRSANLTSNRPLNNQLEANSDLNSPEIKFGKKIGSADQRVRHNAVRSLKTYLTQRCSSETGKGMCELDLMRLWKGLWYCLYMADKVPVQDELSKMISELMWCVSGTEEEDEYAGRLYLEMEMDGEFDGDVDEDDDGDIDEDGNNLEENDDYDDEMDVEENPQDTNTDLDSTNDEGEEEDPALVKHCRGAHLSSLFFRTFLITIRREWCNMDKYRVDKFYTLIRCMMRQVYKYFAIRHYNLGIIRLFNDCLYEEILTQRPNGIRLHMVDLVLEELANANKDDAVMPLTERTLLDCLEPFMSMIQKEKDKSVRNRIMEKVIMGFLEKYSVASKDEVDDLDDLVLDQVHVGTMGDFLFSLGGDEDTRDQHRESLYEAHKAYKRKITEVGRDVDIDEDSDEDMENEDLEDENDMEGEDEQVEAEQEEEQVTEIIEQKPDTEMENEVDTEPEAKKKKKKKKKKSKSDGEENTKIKKKENNIAEATKSEPSSEVVVDHKEKNEKKKKKKKQVTQAHEENLPKEEKKSKEKKVSTNGNHDLDKQKEKPNNEEDLVDKNFTDAKPPLPTLSKKKKKKKKSSELEKVVTITTKHQKEAAEAAIKQQKILVTGVSTPELKAPKVDLKCMDSASKRVLFAKVNYCKSYKASIKDLKTKPIEMISTATRTPDKSILMKQKRKGALGDDDGVVRGEKKKKRKKSKKTL